MEPQKIFGEDLLNIHRRSFNVERSGTFYIIDNPGIWRTRVDSDLNLTTEMGNSVITVKDDEIVIDGRQIESLCWKSRRSQQYCLSASGIKVRIGAIIISHYTFIDQLPICNDVKKMLYYINGVEKNPDVAEFAVKILMAKNTLNDDVLVTAILKEIGKIRLAKIKH